VVLALPNLPATVVAGLALNTLGATGVEVNREWGPEVLEGILAQTGALQAFVWGRDAQAWGKICTSRTIERLWVVHGGPLPTILTDALGGVASSLVLEDGRPHPDPGSVPLPPAPVLTPASPALILYTSGSTGRPRGVVQTFGNVAANTRSIVQYLHLAEDDRALVVLPLYYCYGRSVLQTHLFAGGSVFLESRTAFPRVVLESLSSERCTGMAGVPLTFEIMRRQVDVSSIAFPTLRYLTQAGGAMAPETIAWVREKFSPARLFVMYGQTEATARLSYLSPESAEEKKGSIGVAIPGVELRVVDEQGRELPRGEIGNLVARGGNVTPGYLDEPEETAAILRDGWLWTGDLALRDADGFFFHRGRSKEILKIGGHRVSPIEIEHVVAEHPGVAEAAVIGVAHEIMGEVPSAFVVPRDGETPSEDDLRRFCRERMPAFKVPVHFTFVDALPRNEAGKLLRSALAEPGPGGSRRRQDPTSIP
jgi:acyl-CoA synthetase (AMP-forming)/AMP-acid ligase II